MNLVEISMYPFTQKVLTSLLFWDLGALALFFSVFYPQNVKLFGIKSLGILYKMSLDFGLAGGELNLNKSMQTN